MLVMLVFPRAWIKDVAKDMKRIEEMKEGLKWKDLEEVCNKFCFLPFVHCLWGCKELYHKCEDWVCMASIVMTKKMGP